MHDTCCACAPRVRTEIGTTADVGESIVYNTEWFERKNSNRIRIFETN